jgi:predicted nucleic acid-binding protein
VALLAPRDQARERALGLMSRLAAAGRRLVTTSLVLGESHGLIASRSGSAVGLAFLEELLDGSAARLFWADEALVRDAASAWLKGRVDQPFSLVDAVSFEVMRRERILEAFTFDLDFERAGFRVL